MAQAGLTDLSSLVPEITLDGRGETLDVGPDPGQQTLAGTLEVRDPTVRANSSLVASRTSLTVNRSATGVGATSAVDGFTLTLLGEPVASATSLEVTVTCPTEGSVQADALASELRLGTSAPADVSAGQSARGSATITDQDGTAYLVEMSATVEASAAGNDAEALALRLNVEIDNSSIGTVALALVTCGRPGGDLDGDAPGPDDGLADSGTDTAMVVALLGVVLVAAGGSALLWSRTMAPPGGEHARSR